MKGLDSEAGAWSGPRSTLSFDFGAYSNPLDDSLSTSGTVCQAVIDGKPARIVTYRDTSGQYAVGAHWSGLRSSELGPVSLTIYGLAKDIPARDSLLAAIWAATFRRK